MRELDLFQHENHTSAVNCRLDGPYRGGFAKESTFSDLYTGFSAIFILVGAIKRSEALNKEI